MLNLIKKPVHKIFPSVFIYIEGGKVTEDYSNTYYSDPYDGIENLVQRIEKDQYKKIA